MFERGGKIEEALALYARELPEASMTANAIRRHAELTEISQAAEKEGLHFIASAVFVAEGEALTKVEEPSVLDLMDERIHEFRKHLPATCATAEAIDRMAPWTEISQAAQREGLFELASLVFEAEQLGWARP